MWLVDLNYNFECDWLIELSDNKLCNNKLSNNKLSDNNLASELVENKPITIEEIVIFGGVYQALTIKGLDRGLVISTTKHSRLSVVKSSKIL